MVQLKRTLTLKQGRLRMNFKMNQTREMNEAQMLHSRIFQSHQGDQFCTYIIKMQMIRDISSGKMLGEFRGRRDIVS